VTRTENALPPLASPGQKKLDSRCVNINPFPMNLTRQILVFLLSLGLWLMHPSHARAGAIGLGGTAIDTQLESLLREGLEMLHRTVLARVPGMMHPFPAPAAEDLEGLVCDPAHAPVTHAMLIGVNEYTTNPSLHLRGAENDARLMANTLEGLGADPTRLHLRIGAQANRADIARSFALIANSVGCDDRVIVHLPGSTVIYGRPDTTRKNGNTLPFLANPPVFAPDPEAESALERGWKDLIARSGTVPPTALEGESAWLWLWDKIYSDAGKGALPDLLDSLDLPDEHLHLLRQWPLWGLKSQDDFIYFLHRPTDSPGLTEVILGRELAASVALLRARGAHVVIVLDAGETDPGDLFERSGAASEGWLRYHHTDGLNQSEAALRPPYLPKGAGSITVLEAGIKDVGIEMPLPHDDDDAVIHGLFSFHIAQILLDTPLVDTRGLADAFKAFYEAQNRRRPDFRVTSSNPDLVLVPEALPEARESNAIRLISPDLTRGASAIVQPTLDLVAAVDWPARVLGVWADDVAVELSPDGTFTRNLRLQTGLNRVVLTALTGDSRLHRRVVEFGFDGDRNALKGQGTRYAVLIANQRYAGETGFSDLITPIGDARALGEILRNRFGFVTEAQIEGSPLPLLLEDADRRTILRTLNRLAGATRPEDTVLIFYAGHGVSDPTLGMAAWVPADFERGFPDSAIQASELENALRRFHADNLILISDSCYAGALFRDSSDLEAAPEDVARIEWLLRAQARKSRVLITSGNDQPVLDGGGGGHSVFARALLSGLAGMPQDAFTAAELFQSFLLQPVAGRVEQEPQLRTLRELGHVGGDVVFIATAPPPAGDAPLPD